MEIYAAQRAVITFREEATISGGKMCEYPPSAFVRSAPADPRRARGPICIALAFAVSMAFSTGLGFSVGHAVRPGHAVARPAPAKPAPTPAASSPVAARTPTATSKPAPVRQPKRAVAHKKKRLRHVEIHRPTVVIKQRPQPRGIGDLGKRIRRVIHERVLRHLDARLGGYMRRLEP
ncbi:hypothetical protein ACBJ59_13070 [Nonomuraea sp. MTCD27]|uniref:hypothetical protein n=1 Tax=Nonomuraea sp. MTCD27 TaxID=1676747 RepID=UPI0035C003CF